MRVKIDRDTETGNWALELIPENDVERETLSSAVTEAEDAKASFYRERGKVIYGITAGREDGLVMVGPDGQPPSTVISLF